jgi:hypothetical protein
MNEEHSKVILSTLEIEIHKEKERCQIQEGFEKK